MCNNIVTPYPKFDLHVSEIFLCFSFEPRCEKTSLWGFRPGSTKTGLHNHRKRLGARNFGFRK